MNRSGPPARRSSLRAGKPLARKRMGQSVKARDRAAAHVARMEVLRPLVLARAGYCCERCHRAEAVLYLGGLHLEAHHRLPLGRQGPDTMENLVALCGPNPSGCHGWAHSHPKDAEAVGLLIPSWAGPPSEPWEAPSP